MRHSILLLPILALIGGCAPTAAETARATERDAVAQDKLAHQLAGLAPGKPVDCIDQFRSQQVSAYGPTILYKVSNGLIYRSDTAGGCEHIGRDILITKTPTGRLCRGDIAQTVDSQSHFYTGSCSFGDFTPYRK